MRWRLTAGTGEDNTIEPLVETTMNTRFWRSVLLVVAMTAVAAGSNTASAQDEFGCTYCVWENPCYFCVIEAVTGWTDCATPACEWCASFMLPCWYRLVGGDGTVYDAFDVGKDDDERQRPQELHVLVTNDQATAMIIRRKCDGAIVRRVHDPLRGEVLREKLRKIVI